MCKTIQKHTNKLIFRIQSAVVKPRKTKNKSYYYNKVGSSKTTQKHKQKTNFVFIIRSAVVKPLKSKQKKLIIKSAIVKPHIKQHKIMSAVSKPRKQKQNTQQKLLIF